MPLVSLFHLGVLQTKQICLVKQLCHKFGPALGQMHWISNWLNHTVVSVQSWHTDAAGIDCLELFPVMGNHIFISCKLSWLTHFSTLWPYEGKKSLNTLKQILYTSSSKGVCKTQLLHKKTRTLWGSQCYKSTEWKFQSNALVSYLKPCFSKMCNDSTVKH